LFTVGGHRQHSNMQALHQFSLTVDIRHATVFPWTIITATLDI